MLLENVNVTRSSAQTKNGEPLYLKIDASFRSTRIMFADEIEAMFTTQINKK